MADTFEDLGLRPELVKTVEKAGFPRPTAIQEAAVPVLRRGGNAVVHASAGSGIVAAYGLALLDRLAEEGATATEAARPRALVLVPTAEGASRTAVSLARFARAVDRRVRALAPGWGRPGQPADVLVATPDAALSEVEAARLKLDGVATLVLDGLAALFDLEHRDAVETLTTSAPREAQRVVTSAAYPKSVDDFTERHVQRALHIPARPVEEAEAPAPRGIVGYLVVPEDGKIRAAARLAAGRVETQPVVLYCRTDAAAAAAADALALRGFRAGPAGEDVEVAVVVGGDGAQADAFPVSFHVPFDAEQLSARHAGGDGVVLVAPRELAHLRRIAEEAGLTLQPQAEPAEGLRRDMAAYRRRLREAARREDLGAQLLLLEPLFDELSPVEVAAAASALLRRRAPEPAVEPEARARAAKPAGAPAAGAPRTWVRLFMSIGNRDGIRPGDLVGAITGEAGVKGGQIGRIEIRDTFSIVEVATDIAERVIKAMNGITVKGRSLRVDYDRKSTRRPRRGGR